MGASPIPAPRPPCQRRCPRNAVPSIEPIPASPPRPMSPAPRRPGHDAGVRASARPARERTMGALTRIARGAAGVLAVAAYQIGAHHAAATPGAHGFGLAMA
ncbi:hypothetical protein ACQCRO_21835, partial [Ralstonia pseudosolanacearum]